MTRLIVSIKESVIRVGDPSSASRRIRDDIHYQGVGGEDAAIRMKIFHASKIFLRIAASSPLPIEYNTVIPIETTWQDVTKMGKKGG
jgi:hypothetical protein